MSDEAEATPPPSARHRSVLLVVGLVIVGTAVLLLASPALPPAARVGAGLLAFLCGAALVAVGLLPFAGVGWVRPAFWGVAALAAVAVAVVGDTGVRVPALLVALVAAAQCGLGVLVLRRRSRA